ncbi:hypothetical protein V3C99_018424 [Haemonchus contortus]
MESKRSDCSICGKSMSKYSILEHLRSVHNLSPTSARKVMAQAKKEEFESEGKQTHTCNQCGRIFSSKRGLQIHRSKHSASSSSVVVEEEESRGVSPQCYLCEEVFKTHEELSRHCGFDHLNEGAMGRPQEYVVHNVSFQNSEDFEEWMKRMCELHCTSFFRRSSKKGGKDLIMRSDH